MRRFSSPSHVGLRSRLDDGTHHLGGGDPVLSTATSVSRRRLAAALAVVAMCVALAATRLATAEPVDTTVPTSCTLGGSSIDLDIPLNVDDQVDPVQEGAQETLVTKIGKPNIQVDVT